MTRLYFSFKSVTDRTVINILIILLSTKNCIELTLNYAEFYFPAETSIIPEVQFCIEVKILSSFNFRITSKFAILYIT